MDKVNSYIRIKKPLKDISDDNNIWDRISLNSLQVNTKAKIKNEQNQIYNFKKIFEDETNQEIYQQDIQQIVEQSLKGQNGTVIMYGQTGAGKTYTMIGKSRQQNVQVEQFENLQQNRCRTPNKQQSQNYFNQKSFQKEAKSTTPNQKKQNFGFSNNQFSQTQKINSTVSHNFSIYSNGCYQQPLKEPLSPILSRQNIPKIVDIDSVRQSRDEQKVDGILTLSLKDIFKIINDQVQDVYNITCAYYEVYNEKIYDLVPQNNQNLCLDISQFNNQHKYLEIQENQQKEFIINKLSWQTVETIDEIMQILINGEKNRHYARTKDNSNSSRSHTVFSINITKVNIQDKTTIKSMLNFVDLAGSENVSIHDDIIPQHVYVDKSKVVEKQTRQQESKQINKSILNLNNVVRKLSEKDNHIPYRDSIMTKILKPAFGGNCRTYIICCLNPYSKDYDNSLNTINFGLNAQKIQNNVQINKIVNDSNQDNILQSIKMNFQNKIQSFQDQMQLSDSQVMKQSFCNIAKHYENKLQQVEEQIKNNSNLHNTQNEIDIDNSNQNSFSDISNQQEFQILNQYLIKFVNGAENENNNKYQSDILLKNTGIQWAQQNNDQIDKNIGQFNQNYKSKQRFLLQQENQKLKNQLQQAQNDFKQLSKFNQNLLFKINKYDQETSYQRIQLSKKNQELIKNQKIIGLYQNYDLTGLTKLNLKQTQQIEVNCLYLFQNLKLWQSHLMIIENLCRKSVENPEEFDFGEIIDQNRDSQKNASKFFKKNISLIPDFQQSKPYGFPAKFFETNFQNLKDSQTNKSYVKKFIEEKYVIQKNISTLEMKQNDVRMSDGLKLDPLFQNTLNKEKIQNEQKNSQTQKEEIGGRQDFLNQKLLYKDFNSPKNDEIFQAQNQNEEIIQQQNNLQINQNESVKENPEQFKFQQISAFNYQENDSYFQKFDKSEMSSQENSQQILNLKESTYQQNLFDDELK